MGEWQKEGEGTAGRRTCMSDVWMGTTERGVTAREGRAG